MRLGPSLLASTFPSVSPPLSCPSSVPDIPDPPLSPRLVSCSSSIAMAGGTATVCSMCGDVGFPDKLFRCARCRYRFQHSYCTNYYGDGAPASAGADTCDWCLGDVAGNKQARRCASASGKQQQAAGSHDSSSSGRAADKAPGGGDQETGRRGPTKVGGRRYKLLKDVLC
uniref:Uncharacterized protein n=1 Tax=Avena sativa TaxID=4498 RepID=A0ACD5V2W3_AVESA